MLSMAYVDEKVTLHNSTALPCRLSLHARCIGSPPLADRPILTHVASVQAASPPSNTLNTTLKHLAHKVDDTDDELGGVAVDAHQQRVIHHPQRRQERRVRPQRFLQPAGRRKVVERLGRMRFDVCA